MGVSRDSSVLMCRVFTHPEYADLSVTLRPRRQTARPVRERACCCDTLGDTELGRLIHTDHIGDTLLVIVTKLRDLTGKMY